MLRPEIIKCVFCRGTGKNPYYLGTCPVCKGKGTNKPVGSYMKCGECRGSGRKSGTTLTCFFCKGLGIIPDISEFIKKARKEAKLIQREMEEEKQELYGQRGERQEEMENEVGEREDPNKFFCQSCAKEIHVNSAYKVCEECFYLYKFGEVRKKGVEEGKDEG